MNKRLKQVLSEHDFTEFAGQIAAKWLLRTQRTPSKISELKNAEDILRDLVAVPTVTGNYEANHECFDYIDRFLRSYGMHVTRYERNGIESLVATTRRTKKPSVCLFGHIDVVPAPPDQFQLREKDGKYFGRGVLDMKGGIAAFLGSIQDLGDSLHRYNLAVAITSDEEAGGFDGAAMLAEEGFRPKVMIIPDGGNNWNLERFAKGVWHITIEATGKSAHGSRPWEGENAIDKLIAAIAEIETLFPDQSPETSTINIGTIQGGEAINQIPAIATASIDIRLASAKDQTRIVNKVKAITKRRHIRIVTELESMAVSFDINDPFLQQFAASTERIIGRPVEWIVSNAANDGRWFAKHGIPCAVSYPPGGNHHGPEEYIDKEAFFQLQKIYIHYIRKIAADNKT
jgi:acetylornithine deacetylase/succinyl-diaminopimelate desuccinylase-like protein